MANLIQIDTVGCNADYTVLLGSPVPAGRYITVRDAGTNPTFFASNAIVISTTSGYTFFDGNSTEYIRMAKGSLSFLTTNSNWRLLNTVAYTPLGHAYLSNVTTNDLSIFGTVSSFAQVNINKTVYANSIDTQTTVTMQGLPIMYADDVRSTVAGLGSFGYLSSIPYMNESFASTIDGLGTYGYISYAQMESTAAGLGTLGYISQATLQSTIQGLGTAGYVSSSWLTSTMQGIPYVSSSTLTSTIQGLGTLGYISLSQFNSSIIGITLGYRSSLYSTVRGLGTFGYISSQSLQSSVAGLGQAPYAYISSLTLQSTTAGLLQNDASNLKSTVQGLGQYYISTPALISTVAGIQLINGSNAATYMSTATLFSSVAGLGTLAYVSVSQFMSSFATLVTNGSVDYEGGLNTLGSRGLVSSLSLQSTVAGLGNPYISSMRTIVSTVQGLGTYGYISTATLLATMSTISSVNTAPITSTLAGLGSGFSEDCFVSSISISALSGIDAVTLFSGTIGIPIVNPPGSGTVTTFAGTGSTTPFTNGPVANATFNNPYGIAVYLSNIYISDVVNHKIRLITGGVVSTFAGNGTAAFADGPVANASFNYPKGIAVDSAGKVYVADGENCRIRLISGGQVTTFAGNGSYAFADGPVASASFWTPMDVAVYGSNVYVGDFYNHRIRLISGGQVTTFAGNGTPTFADGPVASASFTGPAGIAVNSVGNVYVADTNNNRIRLISGGQVTTLAGNGNAAFADGPVASASFNFPSYVAVNSVGEVCVSEVRNHRLRLISGGQVTTFAGNGAGSGAPLYNGAFADGPASNASFNGPVGIAINLDGNIYVADSVNNRIRLITPPSATTTLSNVNVAYYANTTDIWNVSLINYTSANAFTGQTAIRGLTRDSSNIYATTGNSITKYNLLTSAITNLANPANTASYTDGTASATFNTLTGIAIDPSYTNLYVCDYGNNRIRKVQISPLSVTTLATVTAPLGIAIDSYSTYAYVTDSNGGLRQVSLLQSNVTNVIASGLGVLKSITLDPTNTYAYVTAISANVIRQVNLRTGTSITLAGSGSTSIDGSNTSASYASPSGIIYNSSNSLLYSTDNGSGSLRTSTIPVYQSTITGLQVLATAPTVIPTISIVGATSNEFVYKSTNLTTTPNLVLSNSTLRISAPLYASTITARTFTASSGVGGAGGPYGYFYGDGTYVTTISDIRTKENIQPIRNALSIVRSLQAVEYTKIDDPSRRWLGYIAQDVEKLLPEIVRTDSSAEQWKSIQYTNLPGLVIEAVKELKEKYRLLYTLLEAKGRT